MGITLDRGYWNFVKRVPKRFAHIDPRQKVTKALWTDSEREARIKAASVEAEYTAYWEGLAAGHAHDAAAAYEAARQLAKARGYPYRPAAELAQGPINDLLTRIEIVAGTRGSLEQVAEARALLGGVEQRRLPLGRVVADFENSGFDLVGILGLDQLDAMVGGVKERLVPKGSVDDE